MAGVNKVMLLGNLGRDPEGRETAHGKVVTFSLATNRVWVDKAGQRQERTEWHRLVAWQKQAEQAAMLKKGEQVHVEGTLEYREFEQDGHKRQVAEVRVLGLNFLGQQGRGGGASGGGKPENTRRSAVAASPSSMGYGELSDSEVPF